MEQVHLQKMDCENEKTAFVEADGEKSVMDTEKKRSSSILKPQKPRNPFSTLDFSEPNPDTTLAKAARRVSFASSNFVKPFAADPDKNTIWDNTYEEEVNHTDSTKSSYEQTQDTKSVDFLNTTSIYTETDETTPPKVIYAKTATSALKCVSLDKENVNPILSDYEEVVAMRSNTTSCSEHFMELTSASIGHLQKWPVLNLEQTVGQCDMELTGMVSVEMKGHFLQEVNASEPDLDHKHALKRKTTYFNESKAQMDITTASPSQAGILKKRKNVDGLCPDQAWVNPLLEKEEIVNTKVSFFDQVENNIQNPPRRETMHFDSSDGDMDITTPLLDNITENDKSAKRKTINFNELAAEMSFTGTLPTADIVKEKVFETMEFADTNQIRNVNVNQTCADMSLATILLSTEVIRENFTKLKACSDTFDTERSADMSLTTVLPSAQVIREASAEYQKHSLPTFKENTIRLDQTGGVDMSFTSILPSSDVIREASKKCGTQDEEQITSFNQTAVDMSFTTVLPSAKAIRENALGTVCDLQTKTTTQFDQTSADMSFTSILPSTDVLREKFVNLKVDNTQINQTGVDMSFTSILPSAEVIKEKTMQSQRETVNFKELEDKSFAPNESDGQLNRKTMLFNQMDANMSLTTSLPNISEKINGSKSQMQHFSEPDDTHVATNLPLNENDSQLNRKTMLFNQTGGNMSLTTTLTNAQVIAEEINGSKRQRRHFAVPDDMHFAPNENDAQLNRKTMLFNQMDGNMSLTTPLPNAPIISEKLNGSKGQTQSFSDLVASNLPPSESDSHLNRKTMLFKQMDGNMSLTTTLPNAQIISDRINGSRREMQHFSKPDYMHTASNLPPNESDGQLNRKTMLFNQTDGGMSSTTPLSNAHVIVEEMNGSNKEPMQFSKPTGDSKETPMDFASTRTSFTQAAADMSLTDPLRSAEDIKNKEIKTNLQLSTLSNSNILYSEPMKIRLKARNFTPIPDLSANLHLQSLDGSLNLKLAPVSTTATSFHMNLTNMSPCIEDTQQLIHATFSRPQSLNVSLSSKENAPLKVRAGGLNEQENISENKGNVTAAPSIVLDNFAPSVSKTSEKMFTKAINEKTYVRKEAEGLDFLDNSEEDFLKMSDSFQSHDVNVERSCYLEDITPLELASDDSISVPEYSPKQANENSDSNLSRGDSIGSDYNNYTLRSQLLLSNIERYCTRYKIDRSEDAVGRAVEFLREFESTKAAIKETIQNFRLPKLDVVDLEQKHKQVMEKRLKAVHEANVEEDKNAPSMAGLDAPKSLYERIYEKGERNKKHWRLDKVEDDYYYIKALFGTVLLKIHIHPELAIVYNIDMEINLKATAKPICWYEVQLFQQKLKMENLSSVLGANFDILTLLDYVYLSVEEIVHFHTEYNSLVTQYGTSHHFRMNSDFSVTVEILSVDLVIFWIITIKLSPTRLVSKDDITAIAKVGESVNEDHIKCIAENTPKGSNFLRNFIENLDEYVKRIEKKIKMKRGHKFFT